jgi:hypothetical protein
MSIESLWEPSGDRHTDCVNACRGGLEACEKDVQADRSCSQEYLGCVDDCHREAGVIEL